MRPLTLLKTIALAATVAGLFWSFQASAQNQPAADQYGLTPTEDNIVTVVVYVYAIYSILWVVRILRLFGTFRTTSDNPPRFTGPWKKVAIHSFTGHVRGQDKQSTTAVSGSIRTVKSDAFSNAGRRVEGSISSKTTTTHSFRLVSPKNQQEMNFQFVDFNVQVFDEQLVSVAWAINRGQKRGPYFVVVNHTTGEHHLKKDAVIEIAKRNSLFWAVSNVICIFNPPVWVLGIFWNLFIRIKVFEFTRSGVQPLLQALNQKVEKIPQKIE